MKLQYRRIILLVLLFALVLPLLPGNAAAAAEIITDPTGYTSASDVHYVTVSGYIANWGARGEDCTFLSSYAQNYYTGDYSFATLAQNSGGTSQTDAPSSSLYAALKNMMTARHTRITSYQETRYQYRYTDCLKNDTEHISSFYSGKELNGQWDSAKTWNREHVWPNSKGLGGSDEDDIMMLRPTWVQENSSRGNTAYGESAGYYDPGVSVRGDCARIVLYTYVRWGNTRKMWGQSGVIENLDILLKWMEEDPVDTWEMGRNDSVQSITGVRNVFVDYPEFAWLLFGRQVPSGVTTPSQSGGSIGGSTPSCSHTNTELQGYQAATCTKEGYTGDRYCVDCQEQVSAGSVIAPNGHQDSDRNALCDLCGGVLCTHEETEIHGEKAATCTQEGYSGDTYCRNCGILLQSGSVIEKAAHTTHLAGVKDATCAEAGYSGDLVCTVCQETIEQGQEVPPSEEHDFGQWVTVQEATESQAGRKEQTCTICGEVRSEEIPAASAPSESAPTEPEPTESEPSVPTTTPETQPAPSVDSEPESNSGAVILAVCCGAAVVFVITFIVIKKKPKKG